MLPLEKQVSTNVQSFTNLHSECYITVVQYIYTIYSIYITLVRDRSLAGIQCSRVLRADTEVAMIYVQYVFIQTWFTGAGGAYTSPIDMYVKPFI